MRSCWTNTRSEIQQLVRPTEAACLNQSNPPFFMSTVQWNRLGLEQQLVCKTLPFSLQMDLKPLFSSWKRWAIRQLRQIQSLVKTPNSLSNGPQKCFLGLYSLLPAVVGILFSPWFFCLRNPISLGSASGILSYCFPAAQLLEHSVFLSFFFFPSSPVHKPRWYFRTCA